MKVVAHDERIRVMLLQLGGSEYPDQTYVPYGGAVPVGNEEMLYVTEPEGDVLRHRWFVTLFELTEDQLRHAYNTVRDRYHLDVVEVDVERGGGVAETLCTAVAFLVRAGYLLTYYQLGSPRRSRGL